MYNADLEKKNESEKQANALMQPPPKKRSAASALGSPGQEAPLPPRSRGASLALFDLSSESTDPRERAPEPVSPGRASQSAYKVPFQEQPGGDFQCRLCDKVLKSSPSSTGNLGKHLERKHAAIHAVCQTAGVTAAAIEDHIKVELRDRSRQPSLQKLWNRQRRNPNAVSSEARWLLWLTKRGIAFDALQDDLFQYAREVLLIYFWVCCIDFSFRVMPQKPQHSPPGRLQRNPH